MKEQDYEILSQYLDGELPAGQVSELERRLAADSSLAAELQAMRGVDRAVRKAFAGADRAPAHVAAMLEQENSNVVPFRRRSRPAWHYAVAASLVAAAGLLLTPDWNQQGGYNGDALLSQLLEQSPSSADNWQTLEDGREVRAVLSFANHAGNWCREYLVQAGDGAHRGVACRADQGWDTVVIAPADIPGDMGDYRPAGAGDADAVAGYLAEHAAGIALSADDEARLIESDWK